MHSSKSPGRGHQAQKVASVGCSGKGSQSVGAAEDRGKNAKGTKHCVDKLTSVSKHGSPNQFSLPRVCFVTCPCWSLTGKWSSLSIKGSHLRKTPLLVALPRTISLFSHWRNGFGCSQEVPFWQSNMARKLKGVDFSGSPLLIFRLCETLFLLSFRGLVH